MFNITHDGEKMSSAIMTLLISHILTFVESELLKEEPALISAVVGDIQSLISKLESLIALKSPAIESAVAPVLNDVSTALQDGVQAVGASLSSGS